MISLSLEKGSSFVQYNCSNHLATVRVLLDVETKLQLQLDMGLVMGKTHLGFCDVVGQYIFLYVSRFTTFFRKLL